jgi:hypothetical protein
MSRTKPKRTYGKGWDKPLPVPSAYADMPKLMTSLANAGWGELSGRDMQGVRSTLHALVHALPYGSAAGKATAYDIASRAGLSLKWTTRCLHLLEDLGVLEWTRGGIDITNARERKGRPGWFRIIKRRVVELVMLARPLNDEKVRAYRAETLERIRSIKTRYTRTRLMNQTRGQQKPRSEHVALNGDPTPLRGGPVGAPPRIDDLPASTAPVEPQAAVHEAPTARGPAAELPADMSGPGLVRAAIVAARLKSSNGSSYELARMRAQGLFS